MEITIRPTGVVAALVFSDELKEGHQAMFFRRPSSCCYEEMDFDDGSYCS